jgi:8-oxo-dGTP pyrophosphatase MutT (NUDIX family)
VQAEPVSDEWPKIKARKVTTISPWMDVIAREVEFTPDAEAEVYHAVGQRDYLAILARTPDDRIPLVRQYRPAMECFTWELPAGLLEEGEDAAAAAARELLEETGYPARATHSLGAPASPCTGRLSNRVHSFFIETGEQIADFTPEPGVAVALKTPAELVAMIKADAFVQQLHLGTLMMAELKGFLKLPR